MSGDPPGVDSPESILETALDSLRDARDEDIISDAEYAAITEIVSAYNEDEPSTPTPEGESSREKTTLATWTNRLRISAKRIPTDLTEATADEINQYWDDVLSGRHPDVKDSGLSKNTVSGEQSTLRNFYEYHDDLEPEREDIAVTGSEKNTVDQRDVYEADDITAIQEAADHPRDRCLVDLFLYTGQRLRAVQTLRIKDIDMDSGEFYLNDDEGGLKGANGKRPLLGAEASVRKWLNYHPNPDDPEAYLICHRQDYRADADGSRPLAQKSIRRRLEKIVDKAGVSKPANPHNFRHTFVTVAKRKYGMDDSTIKGIIGHRLHSRVMEETYSHLKDDDHIKAAQEAVGIREPEDESPLTPDFCTACDEPLPENAKACSNCGVVYTPDAQSANESLQESFYEGQKEAEDERESQAVDDLKEKIKSDPELRAELIQELAEQEGLN